MNLKEKLEAAGLDVVAHPKWETHTNGGKDRVATYGIVNHWDAIKSAPPMSYYMEGNRFNGTIYHIVIRRNGMVNLLMQRYAWHAGRGDSAVLEALKVPEPTPKPILNDTNGNPYLFSVCINYHPDEGPVPGAQYEALVITNRVLVDHFGLTPDQIIDHRGWTNRKRDIDMLSMKQLRKDIDMATGYNGEPNWDEVSDWAKPAWTWAWGEGLITQSSHPKDTLTKEELMEHLKRALS